MSESWEILESLFRNMHVQWKWLCFHDDFMWFYHLWLSHQFSISMFRYENIRAVTELFSVEEATSQLLRQGKFTTGQLWNSAGIIHVLWIWVTNPLSFLFLHCVIKKFKIRSNRSEYYLLCFRQKSLGDSRPQNRTFATRSVWDWRLHTQNTRQYSELKKNQITAAKKTDLSKIFFVWCSERRFSYHLKRNLCTRNFCVSDRQWSIWMI